MFSRFRRPAAPPPSRTSADEPRIAPLDDAAVRAVLVIAAALDAAPRIARAHGGCEIAGNVRAGAAQLSRLVADALLDARHPPPADALRTGADAFLFAARQAAETVSVALRVSGSVREAGKALLGEAGAALREQALDHHDSDLLLALQHGELVAFCPPLTAAQAHVWLMGPLFERVEDWLAEAPLQRIEREAARWWLGRWRSARPLPGDEFPREVREQEFALVERPWVTLGVSPLEYMVEDGLLEGAGPRQRHLARQLLDSVVGVWNVERRGGADAVYRHPLEGTRYRVREHGDTPYGAGDVALGRLIPFGDGTWLRSPGTVALKDPPAGLPEKLAEGMEKAGSGMYPQAALEAMLHVARGIRDIPRPVRPDVTPDQAAELARELNDGLLEIGAAREVDPAEVPAPLAVHPHAVVVESSVDVVLGEYMAALFELSKKSRARRQALRRRARDAKKRGGKGRR
ncbi:MAG TPA: hypothetical protein VF746_22995 [Longimicrobium sp.]|jgi:hypothetical protein